MFWDSTICSVVQHCGGCVGWTIITALDLLPLLETNFSSRLKHFRQFLSDLKKLCLQLKDQNHCQCRLEKIPRISKHQRDASTRRLVVTREQAQEIRNAVKSSIHPLSVHLICTTRSQLNWEQNSTGTGLHFYCRLVIMIRLVVLKGIWLLLICAGKKFL